MGRSHQRSPQRRYNCSSGTRLRSRTATWTHGPMKVANNTVPIPATPPSSHPTVSTITSTSARAALRCAQERQGDVQCDADQQHVEDGPQPGALAQRDPAEQDHRADQIGHHPDRQMGVVTGPGRRRSMASSRARQRRSSPRRRRTATGQSSQRDRLQRARHPSVQDGASVGLQARQPGPATGEAYAVSQAGHHPGCPARRPAVCSAVQRVPRRWRSGRWSGQHRHAAGTDQLDQCTCVWIR